LTSAAISGKSRVTASIVGQIESPFSDIDSEIADPFEVVVDFEYGDDETQITGQRLVQSEYFQTFFLDSDLAVVDEIVLGYDLAGQFPALFDQGAECLVGGILDHRRHAQKLFLQVLQFPLQVFGHNDFTVVLRFKIRDSRLMNS